MNYNAGSDNSVENAEQVIQTNYYGTKNMIKAMVPLMRPSEPGARIVNVSSKLGRLSGRRNVSGILSFLNFIHVFMLVTDFHGVEYYPYFYRKYSNIASLLYLVVTSICGVYTCAFFRGQTKTL